MNNNAIKHGTSVTGDKVKDVHVPAFRMVFPRGLPLSRAPPPLIVT